MPDSITSDANPPRLPETLAISVSQYETLVNAGAFSDVTGQVELVHGRVVRMNPQGPEHADPIDVLAEWSIESVRRQYTVRVEKPIAIPDQFSCPEPDIAWATRGRYSQQHPRAEQIHLLIEVSHSSSAFDRTEKKELYAAAGIPEYWQVDLPSRTVTVYWDLRSGEYCDVCEYDSTQTIAPRCLGHAKLTIASLFSDR